MELLNEELCAYLADRCRDPNIAWPYHPRTGIGNVVVDLLLEVLVDLRPTLRDSVDEGTLRIRRNARIGGERRSKKIDLVFEHADSLTAVEVKACMTAHSKAHPRLVAELTSSADAAIDANSRAKVFVVVILNFGEKFSSPLNLPGPNVHDKRAGITLARALAKSLSPIREISGVLMIPIRFDNEQICEPLSNVIDGDAADEVQFITKLLASVDES